MSQHVTLHFHLTACCYAIATRSILHKASASNLLYKNIFKA